VGRATILIIQLGNHRGALQNAVGSRNVEFDKIWPRSAVRCQRSAICGRASTQIPVLIVTISYRRIERKSKWNVCARPAAAAKETVIKSCEPTLILIVNPPT